MDQKSFNPKIVLDSLWAPENVKTYITLLVGDKNLTMKALPFNKTNLL